MTDRKKFRGTGTALVTPFKKGKIDYDALEKVIEYQISGGIEFLVFLGSTGEASTLSDKEHRQVLDFGIKITRGRKPVVAGVFGGNNTAAMIEKIKKYNFDGIDALLSSNPSYNKPSQEGLFQHYLSMAQAAPRPIIIYNVPSRTASNITAETTLRLAHASENFLAVKEASDDMMQISKILKHRPEHFLVLSGDDFLGLPVIAAGGDGVVSVIGNTVPRLFSDMVRACLTGDWVKARLLNFKLLDLYKLMFTEGNPSGAKAALELQGLCSREVRLPLTPMSDEGKALIYSQLQAMEMLKI
jgi:4-hydroxy-tetrahydrodipicolinate synthase